MMRWPITRADLWRGLVILAITGSVGFNLYLSTRDNPSCDAEVTQNVAHAWQFHDELARAVVSGSEAECNAYRKYLTELEEFGVRTSTCGADGSKYGNIAELAYYRRLTASKCPTLLDQ